jgi:hypothetical protein
MCFIADTKSDSDIEVLSNDSSSIEVLGRQGSSCCGDSNSSEEIESVIIKLNSSYLTDH